MEQLNDILNGLCSNNNSIRTTATQQLQELEKKEGFGGALCHVLVNAQLSLDIRQLAGIILKQYIRVHWFRGSEKFTEPVVADAEKSFIRQTILQVLADAHPKLRLAAAMCITSIAYWDWPQQWPGLVEFLLSAVTSQSQPHIVSGALMTLDMFVSGDDLADQHLPPLITLVMPTLLHLLTDPKKSLSERDRRHALRIIHSIVQWITIVKQDPEYERGEHGAKIQQLAKEWMSRWVNYYLSLLHTVAPDSTTSNGVLITVLETVTLLIRELPSVIKPHLSTVLDLAWHLLRQCLPLFETCLVNADMSQDIVENIEEGDTGDVLGLRVLLYRLIELFLSVAQRQRFRTALIKRAAELIYHLIAFLQLTARELDDFTNDPLEYINNEEDVDETMGFSLRGITAATLWELVDAAGDSAPLVTAITERLQSVLTAKRQNAPHWWKMKEAIVFAVTCLHEILSVDTDLFDLLSFVKTVVIPDLNPKESNIYLINSILVFATKYNTKITPEDAAIFLQTAASIIMEPKSPLVFKLSACRCLASLCATTTKGLVGDVMKGLLPAIVSLLQQCTEEELISEVLKPLVLLLPVDEEVTSAHLHDIVTLLLKTWTEHCTNPHLTDILQSSVERLCRLPRCLPVMLQLFTSPIIKLLEHSTPGFTEIGVDLTHALVRHATWDLLVQSGVLQRIFPKLMTLLLTTTDHSTLEVGVSCLVQFVRIAQLHLVTDWTLNNRHVIVFVLEFINRLLHPEFADSDAVTNLGSLISKLILTVGAEMGGAMTQLLQAVITCLQTATRPLIISTMFVVFCHLMIRYTEQTVDFLSQIPVQMTVDESNQQRLVNATALHFLLRKWTVEHDNFHGHYRTKLSIVALSKLFQLSDPRLDQITVAGDLILSDSTGRVCTRSKSQSSKREEEPFRVRLFKLFVREHMAIVAEEKENEQSSPSDDDSDDDYAVLEESLASTQPEEEPSNTPHDRHTLGKSKRNAAMAFIDEELLDDAYDEEDEEDPDILRDPIWTLNLKDYIENFFVTFEHQNPQLFATFVLRLDPKDKHHLQTCILNKSC
jgi:hypothetical protein